MHDLENDEDKYNHPKKHDDEAIIDGWMSESIIPLPNVSHDHRGYRERAHICKCSEQQWHPLDWQQYSYRCGNVSELEHSNIICNL